MIMSGSRIEVNVYVTFLNKRKESVKSRVNICFNLVVLKKLFPIDPLCFCFYNMRLFNFVLSFLEISENVQYG